MPRGTVGSSSVSARSGNSDTPVIGVRRVPSAVSRSFHAASSSSAIEPSASAASMPPRPSTAWKIGPGRGRQPVGQRFDEPGTGGRIDHEREMRLLDQEELGVAGDATREPVRLPERVVERKHGDGIGAAHSGGEHCGGGSQHVDPRIATAVHRPAGDRLDHVVAAARRRHRTPRAPGARGDEPPAASRWSRTGRPRHSCGNRWFGPPPAGRAGTSRGPGDRRRRWRGSSRVPRPRWLRHRRSGCCRP